MSQQRKYEKGEYALSQAKNSLKRSQDPHTSDRDYWRGSFLRWIDQVLAWGNLIDDVEGRERNVLR